jgi:hypothetical protein
VDHGHINNISNRNPLTTEIKRSQSAKKLNIEQTGKDKNKVPTHAGKSPSPSSPKHNSK